MTNFTSLAASTVGYLTEFSIRSFDAGLLPKDAVGELTVNNYSLFAVRYEVDYGS